MQCSPGKEQRCEESATNTIRVLPSFPHWQDTEKRRMHSWPRNPGNMFWGTHDIQANRRSSIQGTTNFTGAAQNEQNLRNFRNSGIHLPIWGVHGGEKAFLKKSRGLRLTLEDSCIGIDDRILCMYPRKGCKSEILRRGQRQDVVSRPIYRWQFVWTCEDNGDQMRVPSVYDFEDAYR